MKKIALLRLAVQSGTLLLMSLIIFNFPTAFKPVFLASILIFGVFYCGWLCPFGLLQDLGSRLGRFLGIKKRQVPKSLHKVLIYGRYVLAIVALVSVSEMVFTVLGIEPMGSTLSILNRHIPSALAIGVLVGFIAIAMVYERPYCRYFCIEGAKYGFFSLFRVFTIKRNPKTCIQCKKCDKACPMQINITKVDHLRSPQCINCLTCISVCPVKGALSYGVIKKN